MRIAPLNRWVAILAITAFSLTGFNACSESPLSPESGKSAPSLTGPIVGEQQAVVFTEGFESGTKTSYAAATITLGSGSWNLNDALIGTSTSDRKSGTKSARVVNTGKITQQFNVTNGISTVSVKHAKYGTDANSSWELWVSVNSGSTWTKYGSTVSTTSTTLTTATITVNVTGSARIELRKVSGGSARINIDDVVINDNAGGTPPPGNTETESNNTTGTANSVSVFPTTLNGTMSTTTDVDYFKFSVTNGQTVSLSMTVPAGLDYDLYLLNPSSATVASSENGAGSTESISYAATVSGTFYAQVLSYSGSSTSSWYALTVNVTGGSTPPPSSSVHLTLGNPSGAVTSTSYPTNYLMEKTQYAMSYHRDRGIPNWVAWHLDATWLGSTARQDDFRADNTLPSGWYQVGGSSYSGSGFDRGHLCPSADRTKTVADNSSTFLMTNMMPQAPNNNQGPWAKLEDYLRTLVSSGNEVYIYAGSYGTQSTIDGGRVTVPAGTWKVAVVLTSGTGDLGRVTTSTRVIAVDMTNYNASISKTADWKTFRVSVDAIESKTGLDLLNAVSTTIQATIESRVDNL
ncbi:MAG: DNA/RNA non-specific endonuclease [Bacteroidetes bacterium]|nr:DNA/RNA non-specific endonuclease [Bacteroidota bacterium]